MTRGSAPAVAVPLLVGVTVVLAAVIATTAFGLASVDNPGTHVVLEASVSADGEIVLVHERGPPIDVSTVDVRISIDGEPLAHQPPVPYLGGATGFRGLPTGPFNGAADPLWEPGEDARLTVAGSNDPDVVPGATVVVRVVRDDLPIAHVEVRVPG